MNFGWMIFGAYILTAAVLAFRDFRQSYFRAPIYLSQYRRTGNVGTLVLNLAFWLPAVVYAMCVPGVRMEGLGREFFALSVFFLLCGIGFVIAL
jgi:hypothetical protein